MTKQHQRLHCPLPQKGLFGCRAVAARRYGRSDGTTAPTRSRPYRVLSLRAVPVRLFGCSAFSARAPLLELSTVTVFNAGWHEPGVLRRDSDRAPVTVSQSLKQAPIVVFMCLQH